MISRRILVSALAAAALATGLAARSLPREARGPASERERQAVELLDAQASQDARGNVTIRWTTSFESRNLGFHVYRQTPAGRVRITRQLVAGGAFFAFTANLEAGRSYAWHDRVTPGSFAQYSVEALAVDGSRTLLPPITPRLEGTGSAQASPTVVEVSAAAEVAPGVFVSDPGIGRPAIATPSPSISHYGRQWSISRRAVARLMVAREGWIRITRQQLAAAGVDPGPRVARLALYAEAVEQPMLVSDGGDGSFDATDSIEFYGLGLDTPAAGERAYWLAWSTVTPRRIGTVAARASRRAASSTPFTFERIERTIFFAALSNTGERENYFGQIVTTYPVTQELMVEELHTAGSPSLELILQGATESAHRVAVSVNGTSVGEISFSGLARAVGSLAVPLEALAGGANTLELTALEGDGDVSLVESARLTFPRRLVATDNALKLSAIGGTPVTVSGFTTNRIRAVDVTNPAAPVLLRTRIRSTGGGYAASFTAPQSTTRRVLVIGEPRFASPVEIAAVGPATWFDQRRRADLLVITHPSLADAAEPLIELRESQGLDTEVVPLAALYDEFNFGVPGPAAIRNFLFRTRQWATPPRYVLLLGDATADPRGYSGTEPFDYVPTKLVPTEFMKTASDDWLADFDEDGLPEIALGRLPVRTAAEAAIVIGKIVDRDSSSNRVNFIADQNVGDGNDFDAAIAELTTVVPESYDLTTVTIGEIDDDHAAIEEAFDSLLLVYSGHGSVNYWAAGPMVESNFASLENAPALPVMAVMNCLNGYFHDVYGTSAAETLLLNENGGAVAVWASSTLTYLVPQIPMAQAFLDELFDGATIGEAAMRAKAATSDLDVRRSWIVFGDPTMGLR